MYRAICPNCGKAVTLDEPAAVTCPYCKAEIPLIEEQDTAGDFLLKAAEFVETEGYDQIVGITAGKDDVLSSVYRVFAQAMILYRNYIRDAQELFEKEQQKAISNAFRKFATGTDAYAENPLHSHYMDRIDQRAKELAVLVADPEAGEVGKHLAGLLMKKLILPGDDNLKRHLSVVLMADDYSCYPFVPLLTDEDLQEIYATYTGTPDFYLVAPKQFELEKAMKKELKKRGLEVPGEKKGLLSKIKKIFD